MSRESLGEPGVTGWAGGHWVGRESLGETKKRLFSFDSGVPPIGNGGNIHTERQFLGYAG